MAYISTKEVAKIRAALKERFRNMKFSVRRRDRGLAVTVSIMASRHDFAGVQNGRGYKQINHYNFDNNVNQYTEDEMNLLRGIDETIRVVGDHYDKSDIMTDYFNVAFYYDIEIGQWDKPYQKIGGA